MTEKKSQLSLVNKLIISTITIITTAITLGNLVGVIKGEKSLLATLIVAFFGYSTLMVVYSHYRKDPEDSRIPRRSYAGFFFMYVAAIFTTDKMLVFIYILPLLYMYTLYYDEVRMKRITISVVIANILRILWMIFYFKVTEANYAMDYIIQMCSILVACYNAIIATRMMNQINKNNVSTLEEAKQNQEEILAEVLHIGAKLDTNSNEIYSIVTSLSSSSEIMNETSTQISSGVQEINHSILNQTKVTQDIQEIIRDTAAQSKSMVEISNDTIQIMDEGVSIVKELSDNTSVMNTSSNEVSKSMQILQQKTQQINEITNSITAIAHKTNMLSLNASIESARAGEAGKGFAVVASEVGSLAAQTTNSALDIAKIIDELETMVGEVSTSVQQFISCNENQNQLIANTDTIFSKTIDQMGQVNGMVDSVTHRIDDILTANNNIVNSIQQISESSNQAMESISAATSASESNLKQVTETKRIADDLLSASNVLKKYI